MKHLILNNLNFVVTNYVNEVEYNKDDFEISIFHYSSLLEQRHNMVIYNSNRIIKKRATISITTIIKIMNMKKE